MFNVQSSKFNVQRLKHKVQCSKLKVQWIGCFLLAFPLLFTACLDETPKSQLPEEQAYDTAANLYNNAVATLYNYIGGTQESQGLQGTYRGVYDYNTFTTDEAIIPTRGGDWYDGGFWQSLYLHTWTPADVSLRNTWNYLYKVVMLCNHSLAELDSHQSLLTTAQYESYRAEVVGVRCLFYYELLDMFGRVPLIKADGVALDDVKQVERSVLFRDIVADLQDILPYLTDDHSNLEGNWYGRFTRPVAEFLLARLMLNAEIYNDNDWTDDKQTDGKDILFTVDGQSMNVWEACIYYCDQIENAGFTLENDYAANFTVHNETSTENIFVIPMDKVKYQNQFLYLFRSRHYAHGSAIGMDAENGSSATLSTVRAYAYGTDSVDARYAINFYSDTLRVDGKVVVQDDGSPLVYRPQVMAVDLTGTTYEKTAGARMSKYEIDRTAHADGRLQDNDIVLFRYADVLLMRAEAKVRNGQSGQADLDQVRARAGMSMRTATLDNILAERLLELVWEGSRRQDLVRFGLFNKAYDLRPQLDGEESGYTTVFPIPSTALELNKQLEQNPGY
ncbi:MAG: RagB/SusD family nutrient uptake outer membrane protein [Prevotella sp.]|nr:RagB/SusD family nutrient uptake outer membrane protein [Prevotella sp.]